MAQLASGPAGAALIRPSISVSLAWPSYPATRSSAWGVIFPVCGPCMMNVARPGEADDTSTLRLSGSPATGSLSSSCFGCCRWSFIMQRSVPLPGLENSQGESAADTLNWVVICPSGDGVCGSGRVSCIPPVSSDGIGCGGALY